MEDHTFNIESGLYLRVGGHPILQKLGSIISNKYKISNQPYLVPSGMAALTTSIFAIAESRKNSPGRFIFSSEMYTDTLNSLYNLIDTHTPHTCEKLDIWNRNALKNRLKETSPEIHAFIVESASNPNAKVPIWDLIPNWTTLIVDNSWLSPELFNPFEFGADIVIESMTKYWNAGKRFGGFVLCKSKNMTKRVGKIAKAFGMHVPPNHAKEMLQLQSNLSERMSKISFRMESEILPFLENHPHISWVNTWKQPDPSNDNLFPGVVYFGIRMNNPLFSCTSKERKNKWKKWCEDLSIKAATSYGKSYDLVDHWTVGEENEVHIRLSLGFHSNPNIKKDLSKLIQRIRNS
ncbi:MAG: hypothetical protein EU541_04845 [Promethearchaeota archaeon]|nr:MAG: hypothetical protein EU541_04845 [Candidatus Lokiarchaeota archaeon]